MAGYANQSYENDKGIAGVTPTAPLMPDVTPPSYDSVPQYEPSAKQQGVPSSGYNESPEYDEPPPEYSTHTDYPTILDPVGYAYPPPLLPYPDGAAIAAAADYQDMAQKAMATVESHHAALSDQGSNVCCVSRGYLDDIEGNDIYLRYIERNKRSLPRIMFKIQCYHYDYRTEWYRDSQGNQQYREIRERVNTHHATRYLRYTQCWDFTTYPSALDCGADFARVQFVKEYSFKDDYSKDEYERQKYNFITMNSRDAHYDFSEDYILPGFRERMTVKLTEGETPTCMSPACCCLASLFCGCMCYAHWFNKKTKKLYVVSLKVLQISPGFYYR